MPGDVAVVQLARLSCSARLTAAIQPRVVEARSVDDLLARLSWRGGERRSDGTPLIDPRHLDVGTLRGQCDFGDELDDRVVPAAVAARCTVRVLEPTVVPDGIASVLCAPFLPVEVAVVIDRQGIVGDVDLVEGLLHAADTVAGGDSDLAIQAVCADHAHGAVGETSVGLLGEQHAVVHLGRAGQFLRRCRRCTEAREGDRCGCCERCEFLTSGFHFRVSPVPVVGCARLRTEPS